ncbi:FAD-dependent oxidoreductase [Fodinicola feengrottensis]|uniref:FAD-dependent oxidoreductase n=1 Tax=Fodinicola feengrottensis TaxID=435914 RepID=A0ABN2INU4_9ACTN
MTHRIVVAGAGYAGLTAATRLAWQLRGEADITLVNARDSFVERVRLHQIAAGQRLPAYALSTFTTAQAIQLRIGQITALCPDDNELEVESTLGVERIRYDTLVYALGSMADTELVSGVAAHAYTLAQLGPARVARNRILEVAAELGTIAVVGAGATGIEAATEIAESYPGSRVELLSDQEPGWWLSDRARSHLDKAFSRLGVVVRAGVAVESVGPDRLALADGSVVRADVTLWATGFRVPTVAADAGMAVDGNGRILVDAGLRSISYPNIYAVGDAALARTPAGAPVRMGCGTGMPQSIYAADAISAYLTGRSVSPLRFRYYAQNLSLGRRDALIQILHSDDRPRSSVITGRTAALIKEGAVRSTIWAARSPLLDGGPRRRASLPANIQTEVAARV